jgi:hypothetical protein
MSRFKKSSPLAALGLAILASGARADIQTGYLYVSDYGLQALDRFAYDYNTVTNTISNWRPYGANGSSTNAQFISADVKEGLQGTASDIIVVATGGNSLARYGLDGHLIGTINITLNGSAHTLSSVGNVQITSDGKYMYAPESGTGYIDKIDLSNGNIIARAQFAGAHDVLILPNGNIIAAAYTGSNGGSSGLWEFDSNLSSGSKTQLAVDATNHLSRPTGLSLSKDGTTLYVQDNVKNGSGSINQYTINPTTGALTYVKTVGPNSDLVFDFGSDIGPDGNLYMAVLGSGKSQGNFGAPSGFVNGVYSMNTTTDAIALEISGYKNSTGTPTDGFYSPKYLQFGFNFISAPDAGYTGTPEPGSVAMSAAMLCTAAGVFVRRRRARK